MFIFKYFYSEVVLDGYLVDYELLYLFKIELVKVGIIFEKDIEVEVYDVDNVEV